MWKLIGICRKHEKLFSRELRKKYPDMVFKPLREYTKNPLSCGVFIPEQPKYVEKSGGELAVLPGLYIDISLAGMRIAWGMSYDGICCEAAPKYSQTVSAWDVSCAACGKVQNVRGPLQSVQIGFPGGLVQHRVLLCPECAARYASRFDRWISRCSPLEAIKKFLRKT